MAAAPQGGSSSPGGVAVVPRVPDACIFAKLKVGGAADEGSFVRGRKPKPSVIKQLEGNPGKRPLNEREPVPPEGIPDCPDFLNDEARAEWFRIADVLLEMRLLSQADRAALAAYCTAYARWVEAEDQVRKFGTIVKSPDKGFPMKSPYLTIADQSLETMRKFLIEFGLTPASRSRIKVPEDSQAADEFHVFLEAG